MEEPSDDTPSVSPSGCQLPQGGSREMSPIMSIPRPLEVVSAGGGFLWVLCGGAFFPFNRVLAKPWGYGRFSSPLRSSECLSAPIHRGTLPQSRPLGVTAPSEREPGNVPIQRTTQKPQRYGRFSSPLRNSEWLTVPVHWREQKFLVFSYVSCVIRQIVVKWGKIYPAAPAGGRVAFVKR